MNHTPTLSHHTYLLLGGFFCLVILWREINPDCGNISKCYITGYEIEATGPRGEEFANAHTENSFSYSNGNAANDSKVSIH